VIGQTGTTLDVEQVAIGMTVLALDLEADTHADLADVRGGVVVAIDTTVDPDTGEIQRAFTTAKQWRREIRWAQIRADEIRDVLPYSSSTVRNLVRAMARHIAESKGVLMTDDRRCVTAMATLTEVA
jgi:hypothetical protein